jgi:hypothetical protein
VIIYIGGVGYHLAAVLKNEPSVLVNFAKAAFSVEQIYLTAVALPKLSILCFYLRIFISRTSRILTYIAIALVLMSWTAFILTGILQCRPVAYQWDKTIPGECLDVIAYSRATCVPNVLIDLVVMALPLSSIVKLKLPLFKKIALTIIFLTAGVLVHSYKLSF